MSRVRLKLEVSREVRHNLRELQLMSDGGVEPLPALISKAITLYAHLLRAKRAGDTLLLKGADGEVREVVFGQNPTH